MKKSHQAHTPQTKGFASQANRKWKSGSPLPGLYKPDYLTHFNLPISILARLTARAASDNLVALDAKETKFTFAWALASKIIFSEVKYLFADATPSSNDF